MGWKLAAEKVKLVWSRGKEARFLGTLSNHPPEYRDGNETSREEKRTGSRGTICSDLFLRVPYYPKLAIETISSGSHLVLLLQQRCMFLPISFWFLLEALQIANLWKGVQEGWISRSSSMFLLSQLSDTKGSQLCGLFHPFFPGVINIFYIWHDIWYMGDNPHISREDSLGWSSLACGSYLSPLSLNSFALVSISQCPWFHIPAWIQWWQGRTMRSPYGAGKHWNL